MLRLSQLYEPYFLWDYRQADTGSYQLGGERKGQENDWDDWYHGRFARLFSGTANEFNGLELVDAERQSPISINLFRVDSDFYQWAVLNERPIIEGESEADKEWITEHSEALFHAIDRGIRYWTIYDRLVFLLEGGRLIAVDPRFYWPIRAQWDDELTLGHLIAYPYWQRPANESPALVPHYRQANRMRQVRYAKGDVLGFPAINEVSEWEYWGAYEWTGGRVGNKLSAMAGAVEGVWAYGEGNSLYCKQASVVRQIMLRATGRNLVMNRNTFPNMVQARGAQAASQYQTNPDGSYLVGADGLPLQRPNWNPRGNIFFVDAKADVEPHFVEYAGLAAEQHTEGEVLMMYWHFLTGVPPSALGGGGSGQGESGAARMQLMFTAQAYARAARRIIETLLKEVIPAMGGPARPTVRWVMDPMESIMTLYQTALMLHEAGGIDTDELRGVFGWAPKTAEQKAADAEAMNGMAREMGNAMAGGEQAQPAGAGG